jgi:hypothetical protein
LKLSASGSSDITLMWTQVVVYKTDRNKGGHPEWHDSPKQKAGTSM